MGIGYYRDNLLSQKLLLYIFWIFHAGWVFVFRQDGASSTRHRRFPGTKGSLLDFIPRALWPPNSPDLNPVDYSMCSVLQGKVYPSRIAIVDELKTRLFDEWEQFDH